jgi:branched-chain amino acid transport system substrate-binding protein
LSSFDDQSNPSLAKGLVQKAADMGVYAIVGPSQSGMALAVTQESRRLEIPTFIGGEAASITQQGNPYVFRNSFTQLTAMPKAARYIKDTLKARTVSIIWQNNDFGKGGRDEIVKAFQAGGIKVLADISTDPGQLDFTDPVMKVIRANADVTFVYLVEDESARILKEFRKRGFDKPLVGETSLIGQKVIDLAGDAANGVTGHVGLTADAPIPAIRKFAAEYKRAYGSLPDHNATKGYLAIYVIKAATEKVGKVDSKALAKAMKGISLSASQNPGLLMDVRYDDKGDLDRESFIVKVSNGKQEILQVLPPLAASAK